MSRMDYCDFHDHATSNFNTVLNGLTVKGLKYADVAASVDATLKGKITASVDYDRKKDYFLTTTVKASSTGEVKPSVTYEKQEHKMVTDYSDVSIKYQYKVPAIGGAIKTNLLDGLASELHASTVFSEVYQAGFAASYDPSRSGLKQLSYGVVAQNPTWWKKGSVSLSCDGPKAYGLGVSYKCASSTVLSAMFTALSAQTYGFKWTSTDGLAVSGFANTKNFYKDVEVGTTVVKDVKGMKVTVGAMMNPMTMEKKAGIKIAL